MAEIDHEYYELLRVTINKPEPGEFIMANASIGGCALCRAIICGMGGTSGMVCVPCGDDLKGGRLAGCVIRDKAPS